MTTVRILIMQEALTSSYWKNQSPEKVLHSMFFDKNLFMSLVSAPSLVLNAGGAGGRLEGLFANSNYTIHTFDFNEACMQSSKGRYIGDSYIVADAISLPYRSNIFDTVVMLGLLGTLTRSHRMTALREAQRVLKQDGYIVISERMRNPQLNSLYEQQAVRSGENGTLPAYNSDGSIEFYSHHFGRIEMCDFLLEAGITPVIITENYFRSTRSGNIYQGLQVYARNHKL